MTTSDPALHIPVPLRTGLVLAGGQGSRMEGRDKGLAIWQDRALVDHVLARLGPQVAGCIISANRSLELYARRGWPVVPDATADFPGPLAGLLAGLQAATTPWCLVTPCDTPSLPQDLGDRLARALAARPGARIALAERPATAAELAQEPDRGPWRTEPLHALLHTDLKQDLREAIEAGERKVGRWQRRHEPVVYRFDRPGDEVMFANLNTLADLGPSPAGLR